jgi:hypothetical protein
MYSPEELAERLKSVSSLVISTREASTSFRLLGCAMEVTSKAAIDYLNINGSDITGLPNKKNAD